MKCPDFSNKGIRAVQERAKKRIEERQDRERREAEERTAELKPKLMILAEEFVQIYDRNIEEALNHLINLVGAIPQGYSLGLTHEQGWHHTLSINRVFFSSSAKRAWWSKAGRLLLSSQDAAGLFGKSVIEMLHRKGVSAFVEPQVIVYSGGWWRERLVCVEIILTRRVPQEPRGGISKK